MLFVSEMFNQKKASCPWQFFKISQLKKINFEKAQPTSLSVKSHRRTNSLDGSNYIVRLLLLLLFLLSLLLFPVQVSTIIQYNYFFICVFISEEATSICLLGYF